MPVSTDLIEKLLQIKAIKLSPQSPFTWASGMRSPIYCDNRISLSYPEVRNLVKTGLVDLSKEYGDFDMIAGVATAGIAHGALLADAIDLPFCYVRSSAKGHGRQNKIEGEVTTGQKVLVVEDLISTGGSSIEAVKALEEVGVEVVGVIAIFTYQFDLAKKNFENANCRFSTVTNYSELIAEAKKNKYISESEADTLGKWSSDPQNWFDKHVKK